MNYETLMKTNPTVLAEMTNSLGQKIQFVEHPFFGDEVPIICVNHELKAVASTTFYEIDDLIADHKEYEPKFINNELIIGDNLNS